MQDECTTTYTTLLTELTPNLNPNMATAEPTSSHKDTGDPSKLGHNNPDEAAHFLKDITQLTDRCMESISSFNRYAQDTYPTYVFKLHKCMMELDHKYFKYASVDTVLDTIPDKWCKIFVEKPADDTEDTIQQRQSQNTLPTGYNILTRLVHEANHKALDDDGQKVVVELFLQLSDDHDNKSKFTKSISKLGQITSPEQFSFVLKLAMRPLIQLKIPPPHLCSPGDLHFAKERLTKEECFEEMCVNEILPKPFHNKLSTIPFKHATHCLATTTHYLLRKKMFHSKISQAALMKEFAVAEKKLHLAISGRKFCPGKKFPKQKPCDKPKPKKKKAAKTDEPKTDEVVKIPEDKQPSQEDLGEPQSDDADDDDDDDSLPDPFSPQEPKRPKTLGTKEDQDEENTQTQTMDTDMPELISSDEEAAPLIIHSYLPLAMTVQCLKLKLLLL